MSSIWWLLLAYGYYILYNVSDIYFRCNMKRIQFAFRNCFDIVRSSTMRLITDGAPLKIARSNTLLTVRKEIYSLWVNPRYRAWTRSKHNAILLRGESRGYIRAYITHRVRHNSSVRTFSIIDRIVTYTCGKCPDGNAVIRSCSYEYS